MATCSPTIDYESAELNTLVYAARAGDRQAQGELVNRFESSVYALAVRRLGNHAEAQELCQEVFVRALEKLDQLQVAEAFGGWLRSITTRMAINWAVRRRRVIAGEPELIESSSYESRTPLDEALAHEQRDQIRAGLGRLGELDRETLVAFYIKGQSLIEMSGSFDSPVGTIKRRLHVARKRLAKELVGLA